MNLQGTFSSDTELVAAARSVFVSEGYVVEEVQVDGLDLLLAENAYFLVGVVATSTIAQLLDAESVAEAAISDRLTQENVGPKKWDAYLMLLTQELSPENGLVTRGLFEINYDTSRLRRIAHAGVTPTAVAVRSVLAPFIAPTELSDPAITENPFQSMVRALALNGVERQLAQRAIDAFEQGVPLADIL